MSNTWFFGIFVSSEEYKVFIVSQNQKYGIFRIFIFLGFWIAVPINKTIENFIQLNTNSLQLYWYKPKLWK
jgi:hypothetical protein